MRLMSGQRQKPVPVVGMETVNPFPLQTKLRKMSKRVARATLLAVERQLIY